MCFACIHSTGLTSAIAKPAGFPMAAWQALVVYGAGASLLAFLFGSTLLALSGARPVPVMLGFSVVLVAVAILYGHGARLLMAWMVGALLAYPAQLAWRRRSSGA